MKYQAYTLHNLKKIPQINKLTDEEIYNIEVVSQVLPFKTNNYVINELIDWNNYNEDPLFILNFPQKQMLSKHHFSMVSRLINSNKPKTELLKKVNDIRLELNPHPAGQIEFNIPKFGDIRLNGIQHKYKETMLFFPSQGQTCHAYCTFCFRWPQFTGMSELKFAMKQTDLLIKYLKNHPKITDILFTGGDPMVMSSEIFGKYIDTLLEEDIPHLKTIRIGTKALSFWPYRFLTDKDSGDLFRIFDKIIKSGKHLAIMAHFSHHRELETVAVEKAVKKLKNTGAEIRTQSPILNRINAKPEIWIEMWKKQVNMGMVPYYMFVPRETGAQEYFALPLVKIYNIFRQAYSKVSGICRTVRGPSMSAKAGKIRILGCPEINGEKVIVLAFIQARNSEWVQKPFFAKYNKEAYWITDLEPYEGDKFFYENNLKEMLA